MQKKPGVKCFVHSRAWCHSRRIQNFVTTLLCENKDNIFGENWSKHHKTLYKAISP